MITIRVGESWESYLVRTGLPEEYAPPLSSGKPSVKSFWKVVPTDLLELPERDKQLIELVWQSMLQSSSDILSETMFTEQSMYLTEAPLVRPKRWVKFPFARTYLLGTDFTEVTIHSPTGALRREPLGPSRMGIQLRKSTDFTRASISTRTPCSCDVHLRFSADVDLQQLTGLPEFQVGFYSGDGAFQLRSGVFLSVKKAATGWAIGFVAQTSDGRDPAKTTLPPVTALGELPPEWEGDITIEWEPTRRTFRYSVGSLQGRFPVPGRFWIEEMGFTSSAGVTLDESNIGQPTYLVLSRLETLDTSLPTGIKYIPTLQTRASGDGLTLYSGQDYEVNHHREGSVLTFQPAVEIPDYGWAENVGERSYTLRDNFAELLDLKASALRAENSPDLRNLLVGLLYGLLHGPHTESLHTAISALTGAPISLGKGTVVSLYDRQGNPAVIVDEGTRERVYPFLHSDRLVVDVGDSVDFMQVLTDVSPLLTWVDGQPFLRAAKHTMGSEVEKYKVLLIEYPAEIIDRFLDKEEVEQLTRDYLSRALPLWVSAANIIFIYLVILEDRLNLQDEFLIPDETVDLYGSLNRLQDPFIYASPAEPRYGLVPERRYGDFYEPGGGQPFDFDAVSLRDGLEIIEDAPPFDPSFTIDPLGQPVDGKIYVYTDPVEFTGTGVPGSTFLLHGEPVVVGGDGLWAHNISLVSGQDYVIIGEASWGQIVQTSFYLWGEVDLLALEPDVLLMRGVGQYIDAAMTTPVVDGDPLGAWVDQSGNGNNFTQPVSAQRPIVSDGRVNIDGVRLGSSLHLTTPWEVFASVKRGAVKPSAKYIFTTVAGAGYAQIHDSNSGGSAVRRTDGENRNTAFAGSRREFDALSLELNEDRFGINAIRGSWATDGATDGETYINPLEIGGDGASGGADYSFANLLVFNGRRLAESERKLVLHWLEANNELVEPDPDPDPDGWDGDYATLPNLVAGWLPDRGLYKDEEGTESAGEGAEVYSWRDFVQGVLLTQGEGKRARVTEGIATLLHVNMEGTVGIYLSESTPLAGTISEAVVGSVPKENGVEPLSMVMATDDPEDPSSALVVTADFGDGVQSAIGGADAIFNNAFITLPESPSYPVSLRVTGSNAELVNLDGVLGEQTEYSEPVTGVEIVNVFTGVLEGTENMPLSPVLLFSEPLPAEIRTQLFNKLKDDFPAWSEPEPDPVGWDGEYENLPNLVAGWLPDRGLYKDAEGTESAGEGDGVRKWQDFVQGATLDFNVGQIPTVKGGIATVSSDVMPVSSMFAELDSPLSGSFAEAVVGSVPRENGVEPVSSAVAFDDPGSTSQAVIVSFNNEGMSMSVIGGEDAFINNAFIALPEPPSYPVSLRVVGSNAELVNLDGVLGEQMGYAEPVTGITYYQVLTHVMEGADNMPLTPFLLFSEPLPAEIRMQLFNKLKDDFPAWS